MIPLVAIRPMKAASIWECTMAVERFTMQMVL